MKKAQTWSLDLLLGLTVFLVIFIAVFGFINYISKESINTILKEESELILASIEAQDSAIGFIKNNEINQELLTPVSNLNGYELMRDVIGTKHNFCIYFEDENGNLLNMQGELAGPNDQVGIGNEDLKINEIDCGAH